MRKNNWLFLFVIVLVIHLLGILISEKTMQLISKPLIVPVLIGYFFTSSKKAGASGFAIWILLALFFSWVGDILLMFQEGNSVFFLLGLSAFLLAHICYIVFFHRVRLREAIAGKGLLLVIVVIYYGALLSFLSPYLGEMKLPVKIYGVVISFMFMLAMHMAFLKNKTAGWLMLAGSLLFIISDSVLAINKFYEAFEGAGFIIMFTYGLAQLFITAGAIRYIADPKQ